MGSWGKPSINRPALTLLNWDSALLLRHPPTYSSKADEQRDCLEAILLSRIIDGFTVQHLVPIEGIERRIPFCFVGPQWVALTLLLRLQNVQHRDNISELRIILAFLQCGFPLILLEEVFTKLIPPNPIGLRKKYGN